MKNKKGLWGMAALIVLVGALLMPALKLVSDTLTRSHLKAIVSSHNIADDDSEYCCVTFIKNYSEGCLKYRIDLLEDLAANQALSINVRVFLVGDYSPLDVKNINKIYNYHFEFERAPDSMKDLLYKHSYNGNMLSCMVKEDDILFYDQPRNPIQFNQKIQALFSI